jgi:CheY-like chemotaxis protein
MDPCKVLIIDDDDDIREPVVSLLRSEGFQAEGVKSALTALTMMTGGEIVPDAILLDLLMPAMSGEQFRAVMRGHPQWSRIPIIVCTANRPPDPRAIDVFEVLAKPFDLDSLLAAVGRACRRRTVLPP